MKSQLLRVVPHFTYICKNAFFKCKSLNHVIIPPSVTEIDSCAFGECINLTDFKLILAKQLILDFMHNQCLDFKINYEFINVVLFVNKKNEELENCFKRKKPYIINMESHCLPASVESLIRDLYDSDFVFLFIDASMNEQFLTKNVSVDDTILCMHYFQMNSVIIVVDQMESVKYSEERFNEIKNEMTSILIQNEFDPNQFQFVPISQTKFIINCLIFHGGMV